ncbi:MAG: hypothetical protein REV35_01115 [Burkholderia sp.]|nr:hypothetical protein [Burkholderia sp.]
MYRVNIGESLLDLLEMLQVKSQSNNVLRFPIQDVFQQNSGLVDDFRNYMGRIESGGEVKVGR